MQTKTNTGDLPNGQLTTSNDPRRHVRSQTPQESLGLSGKSGLFKASVQAGIIFAIGFAVLTFIPFLLESAKGTKATVNANPAAAPGDQPADTSPSTAPQPSTPTTPKTDTTTKTPTNAKIPGKDDILNKLGETGTKTGSPKSKDPFKANGDDDLFK